MLKLDTSYGFHKLFLNQCLVTFGDEIVTNI